MRRLRSTPVLLSMLALSVACVGCGSDPAAPDAAGRDTSIGEDAFVAAVDAPSEADAPIGLDAPAASDSGSVSDAPAADDAWRDTCPEGLGAFCEDAPCPSGFECMVGRCAPQARQICGGFAGARCTEPEFTQCIYFSSADFGPCLTPDERRCICDDPERAAGFDCP
jgi:hypothetical protein